jgi:trehalose 2-sulfotransferase
MTDVRLAYLVCATPRSGSTLLCKALARTGVAGRPEEYFEALPHSGLPRQPREYVDGIPEARALPPLRRDAPLPQFADRLAEAQRLGTTPNGVFGAKVMWGYFAPVLDGLGRAPEAQLPGLRYVLVRRRDKLRQAISLWRAVQTAQWNADDRAGGEPAYSRAAIDLLRGRLADEEAAWERWLAGRGALALTYENFEERPGDAVAAVLDHLGLEAPAGAPADAPLRRQADALTEDWVRRHTERAA